MDNDPSDRRFDRLMAYLGLLDDAAPLFRPGTAISGAGVLLAMPALVAGGVIECAREVYGSIGPAFFGLRTTIVSLVLMALLRIKRPEGLKERPPDTLGRILGLDRAPEVKTLRRKLRRLAGLGRSTRFGRAPAERRVAARGALMGFLGQRRDRRTNFCRNHGGQRGSREDTAGNPQRGAIPARRAAPHRGL